MELDYRKKLERHLKRKLKTSEIVHHKDGNDRNNKLSNLQVCTRSEHVMFHKELRKKKKPTEWKQELNDYKNIIIDEQPKMTDLLSALFTERQQHIIYLKLKHGKLSKTEREYFCRIIKPKLQAIAYSSIHKLAEQFVLGLI